MSYRQKDNKHNGWVTEIVENRKGEIESTFCDPKSFAWEHEFKVFVEEASKDQFGLKVKLPNGNL
jgi:hypothetical protein